MKVSINFKRQKTFTKSLNSTAVLVSTIFLFLTASCRQTDDKTLKNTTADSIPVNTTISTEDTDFVVIKAKDNPKATDLTADEINELNEIYSQCIADNISHLRPQTYYKRQYFPFINDKGEKEIWINCF